MKNIFVISALIAAASLVTFAQQPAEALKDARAYYESFRVVSGDKANTPLHPEVLSAAILSSRPRASEGVISDAVRKRDSLSNLIGEESKADPAFPGRLKDELLLKAASAVQEAFADEKTSERPESLLLKGNIFTGIAERSSEKDSRPGTFAQFLGTDDAELIAMDILKSLVADSGSGASKEAALKGLFDLQPFLGVLAVEYFGKNDYMRAGRNLDLLFEAHDILSRERVSSFLKDKNNLSLANYYNGRVLVATGKQDEGRKILEKLFKDSYREPGVYETLYKLSSESDGPDTAFKYLEKGRKLLPEDSSLLILEINHSQKTGNSENAIEKIKEALEKQPGNVTLRASLANAYDRLYLTEVSGGDPGKADEYFRLAEESYKQAIDREPGHQGTVYALGALYFNKAAIVATDLAKYQNNSDPEAVAKFDATLKKVYAQFDLALPYLKKAESMDANDEKTLNALMQIFGRKGEGALADEFRRRLARVQAGGRNPSSYYGN